MGRVKGRLGAGLWGPVGKGRGTKTDIRSSKEKAKKMGIARKVRGCWASEHLALYAFAQGITSWVRTSQC